MPAFKCIASPGKRSVTAAILIASLWAIVNSAIGQSTDLTAIDTNSQQFADLISRAEHGDVKAEGALALAYTFGVGVPTNYPEAFHWLLKSGENGNSNLWYNIGDIYFNGDSSYHVASNHVEAAKWYLKAADQGNAAAQRKMGVVLSLGIGAPEDDASALKWFQRAAAGNDEMAEYYLGSMYANGQTVPQDYALAAEWYRKSANQGFTASQNDLGLMYEIGQGVPQDYALAAEWYRKAANQGDAAAQNNLGVLYQEGHGVPKDSIEAYKWFDLAAAQGNSNAIQNSQTIDDSMTPSQIAQAGERARDFKPDVPVVPDQTNSVWSDAPANIRTR